MHFLTLLADTEATSAIVHNVLTAVGICLSIITTIVGAAWCLGVRLGSINESIRGLGHKETEQDKRLDHHEQRLDEHGRVIGELRHGRIGQTASPPEAQS